MTNVTLNSDRTDSSECRLSRSDYSWYSQTDVLAYGVVYNNGASR
jgi:hypothetical protein